MTDLVTDLLNILGARAARDEAIQRAEDGASPAWSERALRTVRQVAEDRATFTTADVWRAGLSVPREPRALGPVMVRAAGLGWIERTDRTEESGMERNHNRRLTVWRSHLVN